MDPVTHPTSQQWRELMQIPLHIEDKIDTSNYTKLYILLSFQPTIYCRKSKQMDIAAGIEIENGQYELW